MAGIASIQDVLALESAPWSSDESTSTYSLIEQAAQQWGQKPALSFFMDMESHRSPMRWTYRDLLQGINQTANAFRHLGVTRQDTVAYILPNLPETHLTIWGGQAAGRVAALNPLLEGAALAELLNAVSAKVLVTLAPFPGTDLWNKIKPHLAQVPSLRHVVLVDAVRHVKGRKRIVAKPLQQAEHVLLRLKNRLNNPLPWGTQLHNFHTLIQRFSAKRLLFADRPQAADVSSCFCTGGTTGLPKVALRTHRNEVFNAWSAARFLGDGMGAGKTVLCGLPLFHVNGVLVTGLLPFSKGAHVVLAGPQGYRTPGLIKQFWSVVEYHRIHFFSGVPTLYSSLLEVPIGNANVSTLEYGLCGAAPMPEEVFRRFEYNTGLKILEGYGLTEGTCVSAVNPPLGQRKLGSIGLRIPHQQMKAVRLGEQGEYLGDCEAGEVGALVISGPNVFLGYATAEQNTGLWIDCGDGQKWLNTGDLGRCDEEGYFFLTGRKKELIIRGGHNIDPKLIEDVLHQHPQVQLAAAVGRPDAHAGELPVAYVQLVDGGHCTEAELITFCQAKLSERAAVPKAVVVLGNLPLTPIGKIFKPDLKMREIESVTLATLQQEGMEALDVRVEQSKQFGFLVHVTVSDTAQMAKAQASLGLLPLRIDIVVANSQEQAA